MTNKVFIPLLVVFLVVVSTATLLATKTWNPAWNPFQGSGGGGDVIEKAFDKISQAKTISYQGSLLIDTLQDNKPSSAVFNLKGSLDTSNEDSWQTANLIDFSFEQPDSEVITAGFDLDFIAKSLYLRINSLPETLSIPFLSSDFLQSIKGKWIGISEDQAKQLAGVSDDTTSTDQDEQTKEALKLFISDLKEIGADKEIFSIKQQLADETIDGENTTHYLVDINKEAVKEMIPEYYALMQKYGLTEGQDADYLAQIEEAMQSAPQAIDDAWEKIGGISFEAWISSNRTLKRLIFEKTIDSSQLEQSTETSPIIATIKIDLTFSDINKSVNLSAPQDAMTIEDLLTSLGLFGGVTLPITE